MHIEVDNAIILAAGFASRFVPLSYEYPKGLTVVKGEVLIERQIRQLQEAGIQEIILVTGYLKEKYTYLKEKFQITLVENNDYSIRNNHSSIYAARNYIKNSYICSSDNYFVTNPFHTVEKKAFYSASYSDGPTEEWCLSTDTDGLIKNVTIGGRDAWFMLGHAFWDTSFSKTFLKILEEQYHNPEIKDFMWEHLYIKHILELPLYIKQVPTGSILEFDSLEELRNFDLSYETNSHSKILRDICKTLSCKEKELHHISPFGQNKENLSFLFTYQNCTYCYFNGLITKETS